MRSARFCLLFVALVSLAGQALAQIEGRWIGAIKTDGIKGANMTQVKSGEITLNLDKDGTFVFKQLLPDGDRKVQSGTWSLKGKLLTLVTTKVKDRVLPEKDYKQMIFDVADDGKSFSRDMTKNSKAKAVNSDGSEFKLAQQLKVILTFSRPKS